MTTSAPIRKVHDIPIVLPKRQPKQIPAPSPKIWFPIVTDVPERVKEPVRLVPVIEPIRRKGLVRR